jgi:hypothetical protein
MKDLKKLKEYILDNIDLTALMLQYGVKFVYNPRVMSEVQYHCPFHGNDTKPSSRLYKESRDCWCWKCHKRWDVIEFVKDKEGLSFVGAVLFIINRYNLDISQIPDIPTLDIKKPDPGSVIEETVLRLKNSIREKRGKIPLEKYVALCTAWYMVSYARSQDKDIQESLTKLNERVNTL